MNINMDINMNNIDYKMYLICDDLNDDDDINDNDDLNYNDNNDNTNPDSNNALNDSININDSINKPYFNCGCCDNCMCDGENSCINCSCNCNGEIIDDDYDYYSEDDDENNNEDGDENKIVDEKNNPDIKTIINDTKPTIKIKIIGDDKKNKKTVRITLELNVILSNKNELISIDIDINKYTYLKIAQELL